MTMTMERGPVEDRPRRGDGLPCIGCERVLPPWREWFCDVACVDKWQREFGSHIPDDEET